jgi:hypothetical protein
MKEIVWLLDVDGVINANKAGWSAAPRSAWAYSYNGSWKMRWAPQLIERIWKIHNTGLVNIVWATTWCGYTDQLERIFRLPALNSALRSPMSIADKQYWAERVVDDGCNLIWTDDEAIPFEGELHDKLTSHKSLLIAPKPNRGLRPEHLDLIDSYVLGKTI